MAIQEISKNAYNFTALIATAVTTQQSSNEFFTPGIVGADFTLNITAGSGLSLTLFVEGYDPLSNQFYTLYQSGTGAFTGVSKNTVQLWPSGSAASLRRLPPYWRVRVANENAAAATYTVTVNMNP